MGDPDLVPEDEIALLYKATWMEWNYAREAQLLQDTINESENHLDNLMINMDGNIHHELPEFEAAQTASKYTHVSPS